MDKEEIRKKKDVPDLSVYMSSVIAGLHEAGKHSAVHTYTCTLRSFAEFSGERGMSMSIEEAFTPRRLKIYQEWLLGKNLSWNSISTYMRTLRAVCNRIFPPGSPGYDPKRFDGVYTKVESQTKRALTQRQMECLLATDVGELPEELQRVLSYFLLMFLFRGMPFIDLAHLRKRDVKGKTITYCRHKTGRQMTVSILPEAVRLIKAVSDENPKSIYLFPILDYRLKDGLELYHCYLDALRRFNKGLERVAAFLLPGVRISSYLAKHNVIYI